MPTQKETVLNMLKAAGNFGVRSDTYLAEYIPRAAARVKELREEGYEITSEREQQFVRYTLQAPRGVETINKTHALLAPLEGPDSPGPARREEQGDESVLPAVASEDLSLFEQTSYERLQDAA